MTGKRHGFHATWRVGFDDDGRLAGARRDADRRRRLEPRPVRAGAGPRAVPHRQRLLDPEHPRERPDRQDEQDLADRLPRLRRPAGHARDRGHPRPVRAAARARPDRAAAPQLLRRAAQTHAVRAAGPARRAAGGVLGAGAATAARSTRAAGGDRGVQRRAPDTKRGAGDDAGEVRHLVQPDRVQPGRRARARLQGRLGADQPRRHRDGPGAAHQDAAGRGHDARRPAGPGPAGADAHRQGAQHLGHRGELGRRPQRRRRSRTPASRSGTGSRRSRRSARHQPADVRFVDGVVRAGRRGGSAVGGARPRRLLPARAAVGGRLLPHRGAALGLHGRCTGSPFKYFAYGVAAAEVEVDGFTGAYTHAARRHRARRRRQPLARWSTSARSRAGSSRAPAG